MTYHNAIKYIKNAPTTTPSNDSARERILLLCDMLGNPQKKIKYIRLAGNNGKSVCAKMMTAILNDAEICCGSLTMPLLFELRENVRINGVPLSIDEIIKYTEAVASAAASINAKSKVGGEESLSLFSPTSHEIMLCVALLAFVDHGCKLAMIECDHHSEDPSRFLPVPLSAIICGAIPSEDLQEIAKIRSYIQRGINEIISVPQNSGAYEIIANTCHEINCRLTISMPQNSNVSAISLRGATFTHKKREYTIRICGRFQVANAILAIESAEMLVRNGYKISKDNIKNGLFNVVLPSKFEVISISPTIIVDSTHAPIAIETVSESMAEFKPMIGSRVRLCLPYGNICERYIDALEKRGFDIAEIIAVAQSEGDATSEAQYGIPLTLCKNAKQAARAALSRLGNDEILLVSGRIDFSKTVRYEILSILGFN